MEPHQKRKRESRRPSNWWEAAVSPAGKDALQKEGDGIDGEVGNHKPPIAPLEEKSKRGRGRPSKEQVVDGGGILNGDQNSSEPIEDVRKTKSKKRRPSVDREETAASPGPKEQRSRGRPSRDRDVMDADEETVVAVSAPFGERKKGRGKVAVVRADADIDADTPTGAAAPAKRTRGRPEKETDNAEDGAHEQAAVPVKNKRGRPSLEKETNDIEVPIVAPKKRGKAALESGVDERAAEETMAPKKRGRKPNVDVVLPAQNVANEDPVRRRGRLPAAEPEQALELSEPARRGRHSKRGDHGPEAIEATDGEQPGARRRGRRNIENDEQTSSQPTGESSRRKHDIASDKETEITAAHAENKKRKTKQSEPADVQEGESSRTKKKRREATPEEASQQQRQKKKKKRVRISDIAETIEAGPPHYRAIEERTHKQNDVLDAQEQGNKKRRRIEEPESNQIETEQREKPSYRHLAPVTRRVSRETIDTKWEPLPTGSLDKISDLLLDVQRPVVLQVHDERKKTQASTAIHMVSRRLQSRIRKGMPFPKSSRVHKEDEFDFEKILDHNRNLEAELTPVLHSIELLEAELRKEEIILENEEKYLADLESNAKDEASTRRQAARKVHPLLQPGDATTPNSIDDMLGPDIEQIPTPATLDTSKYQDLDNIFNNLKGHVDSIYGNLQQVRGVGEVMAKSKAAVQATLFNHLDREQYEDVVLG